jgi:putative oxidoreductase
MSSLFEKISRGYGLVVKGGNLLQPVLLLAIRLIWGWRFFESGLGKLKNLGEVAEYFGTLGIPFPMVNATVAAVVECGGGALLLIGLATRLASVPLIITMIVAYLTADKEAVDAIFSDPDKFLGATPFLFLFASLILLVFGPGVFSVDYLIKRFVDRKASAPGKSG